MRLPEPELPCPVINSSCAVEWAARSSTWVSQHLERPGRMPSVTLSSLMPRPSTSCPVPSFLLQPPTTAPPAPEPAFGAGEGAVLENGTGEVPVAAPPPAGGAIPDDFLAAGGEVRAAFFLIHSIHEHCVSQPASHINRVRVQHARAHVCFLLLTATAAPEPCPPMRLPRLLHSSHPIHLNPHRCPRTPFPPLIQPVERTALSTLPRSRPQCLSFTYAHTLALSQPLTWCLLIFSTRSTCPATRRRPCPAGCWSRRRRGATTRRWRPPRPACSSA